MRFLRLLILLAFALPGLAKADFVWDVASNVDQKQIKELQTALARAEEFYSSNYSYSLSRNDSKNIRIRVIANGNSNTCCQSKGNEIFFDVLHEHWLQKSSFKRLQHRREKIFVHEYAHEIQQNFGASRHSPEWMNEGMAEYFAYEYSIQRRFVGRSRVNKFMVERARVKGQLDIPIRNMNKGNHFPWPGHVGYVAIVGLLDETGKPPSALFDYLDHIRKTRSHAKAFELAFGMKLDDFHSWFEAWQVKTSKNRNSQIYWNR